MATVNESGLYKLIMRSDKPQAREFQDWVTREVLPSIRRTGWGRHKR
jgi:prophage antirepressor-like protein